MKKGQLFLLHPDPNLNVLGTKKPHKMNLQKGELLLESSGSGEVLRGLIDGEWTGAVMGYTAVINRKYDAWRHTQERCEGISFSQSLCMQETWENQRFSLPWSCSCHIAMLNFECKQQSGPSFFVPFKRHKADGLQTWGYMRFPGIFFFLLFKQNTAC